MKKTVTLIHKTKVVIEVENNSDAVRQAKAIASEVKADEIEIDDYVHSIDYNFPINTKHKNK